MIGRRRRRKMDFHISWVIGNGMRCVVNEYGISLKGSIPKMYQGNNIEILERKDIYLAFDKIGNEFKIPIGKAKMTRLDIGSCFVMKYPPELYYPYLGKARYFERKPYPESIRYENKSRAFVFYDKVIQSNKAGEEIPEKYWGKEIMRVELRYLKKVERNLNLGEGEG